MQGFVDHDGMVKAAEFAVREEARRHPDSPWRMQIGDTHEFANAVADARKRLRNELLLTRLEQVQKAAYARDLCLARGEEVFSWARNTLAWASDPRKITELFQFDEEDDVESVDAMAALSRALA